MHERFQLEYKLNGFSNKEKHSATTSLKTTQWQVQMFGFASISDSIIDVRELIRFFIF